MGSRYVDASWDYRGQDTKTTSQMIHNYPAMMIPQVAGRLVDMYGVKSQTLLDPFCGSGSVLVEARLRGLNCVGVDINPLARLIASVRTSVLDTDSLRPLIRRLEEDLAPGLFSSQRRKHVASIPVYARDLEYWFKPDVVRDLSHLRSILVRVRPKTIRNFLLVSFSETVRDCSNTRGGEFKLYRITESRLAVHRPDVFGTFLRKLQRNYDGICSFSEAYRTATAGAEPTVRIIDGDSRRLDALDDGSIDLVVTSPPYGDSHTTVAYGQFSRLSLKWLGLYDPKADVDRLSLGGKAPAFDSGSIPSPKLSQSLRALANKHAPRKAEVESFYVDLWLCMKELGRVVRRGGAVCMVVGNRTVKNEKLPTDEILVEMGEGLGFHHERTMIRNIPSKRMPLRNSPTNVSGATSETMHHEYIVVLKH